VFARIRLLDPNTPVVDTVHRSLVVSGALYNPSTPAGQHGLTPHPGSSPGYFHGGRIDRASLAAMSIADGRDVERQ
jgi:hypothetical protein